MWNWFKNLYAAIADLVIEAERDLKDKTGAERRQWVVDFICDSVSIPAFLKFFLRGHVGRVVDKVCDKLNLFTGHDILSVSEAEGEVIAALPKSAIAEAKGAGSSVDERLAALYRQYGIEAPAVEIAVEPAVVEEYVPPAVEDPAPKTGYFNDSEFACKCGCGFAKPDKRLVDTLNAIRGELGKPIVVMSGCRCKAHNKKVGGVANSNHTHGTAADIQSNGVSAADLWSLTKQLYGLGWLSELAGLGRYDTFVHVDIAPKVAGRLREWDERTKK